MSEGMCLRLGDGSGYEQYRTCGECGEDCVPELASAEELGVSVVFVCPDHGVHSVVDPLEGLQ